MSRRRFLVEEIRDGAAELRGEDAWHLARVLRAAPGMEAFAAAASSARASNSPLSRAPSNKNPPHWTPTLATLPAPGWRLRGEQ